MALPATESFTGAAGALTGSWTQQSASTTVNRNGAGVGVASSATEDGTAFWNADTFNADQYSQAAVISVATGNDYTFVCCRMTNSTSATRNLYQFYTDGVAGAGHTELAKYVNGVQTVIQSLAATFAANDVMKIDGVGTTITCYKNGAAIQSKVDSSLSAGAAGCGLFSITPGNSSLDTWEGGNVGGAGFTPIQRRTLVPLGTRVGSRKAA